MRDWGDTARTALAACGLTVAMAVFASPSSATERDIESEAPTRYCHKLPGASAESAVNCISVDRYSEDICRAIAVNADVHRLPRGFFARLIWQESGFNPNAVSHKGALGVAQFIPSTARLRGLENPMNPAEALAESARYLRDLKALFGNLGLAAAAYNAGENRVRRMIATNSAKAPLETENYVRAITGRTIAEWLKGEPNEVDFTLGKSGASTPFHQACLALAETRTIRRFQIARAQSGAKPWGVQIAAHQTRRIAQQLFEHAKDMLPDPLRTERPVTKQIVFKGRRQYSVQYGRAKKIEARMLCVTLRLMGVTCNVVKN